MRMWMVNQRAMCRRHLLGEHCECHMFLGSLRKQKSMAGYITNNLFEPKSLKERHDSLAIEMQSRGYKHKTPLDFSSDIFNYLTIEQLNYNVDYQSSLQNLIRRCSICRSNFISCFTKLFYNIHSKEFSLL